MLTDDEIAKLKEAKPDAELHAIPFPDLDLEVVARVPNEGEWKRFREAPDEQSSGAVRTLVFSCVVFPPAAEFAAHVGKHPGIVEVVGGRIVKAALGGTVAKSRKL